MEISLGERPNHIKSLPHPIIKDIPVKHQPQIRKALLQAQSNTVCPQIHQPP